MKKMIQPAAVFLWRKVDHPGHDSCRLFKLANGWRLNGAAIFRDNKRPSHLGYVVAVDNAWETQNAKISGYIGKKRIDVSIASAGAARWKLNIAPEKIVTGCVDVDLGFTPATNLIVLRRLALKVGTGRGARSIPAASGNETCEAPANVPADRTHGIPI